MSTGPMSAPMSTGTAQWPLWSTSARLVVTDRQALDEARRTCDEVLAAIDRVANRFRPDSEIRNLRPAADGTVDLSPTLAELVRWAIDAAALTDGSVDPTVGGALAALGYDRDIALVTRDGAPAKAVVRAVPGWRRLRLDGHRLHLPAGVTLDLGASAKAVAADTCARRVAELLGTGVLVGIGGDIATAGPGPETGWRVLVQDQADDPVAHVVLEPGTAVATSSSRSRRWRQGETEVHHIVDPTTGTAASTPWRSVTVAARSCFQANTASTATIARGEQGLAWLARLGLPARLVHRNGSPVVLGGWPGEVVA